VFAPDISYHDGTFYIVTARDAGHRFRHHREEPAAPWSDPIWLPFEGIDPLALCWEGDRAYIVNNRAPAEPPRWRPPRHLDPGI
jgi:alpha-N-arabinofuranosidase